MWSHLIVSILVANFEINYYDPDEEDFEDDLGDEFFHVDEDFETSVDQDDVQENIEKDSLSETDTKEDLKQVRHSALR